MPLGDNVPVEIDADEPSTGPQLPEMHTNRRAFGQPFCTLICDCLFRLLIFSTYTLVILREIEMKLAILILYNITLGIALVYGVRAPVM